MPLKPSILKGIESILGAKTVESFVNEKEDFLILEDNSGRVRISNRSTMPGFSPSNYISGITAAVKGRLDEKGIFSMEDICYYSPYQISIKQIDHVSNDLFTNNNKLVAFVSGLNFGLEKDNYSDIGKLRLMRKMLLDTFQGRINNNDFKSHIFKRIENIIISGNIIYTPDDADLVEKGSFLKTDLNNRVYKIILQNYTEADTYISSLCNTVHVHLMPGVNDNSSSFFPQSAINNIMLPKSSAYDSFHPTTNPYKFKIDQRSYLGTSGQNIENIKKYTNISKNSTDLLEKTLEWGHLAPSAPDTLRTYPFHENDPLIIKEYPEVYFTGNQKTFETKLISINEKPIRLISIPQFCETGSIVLLDTETLNIEEFRFKVI
jgi:DNA polymerase delta subunit 2